MPGNKKIRSPKPRGARVSLRAMGRLVRIVRELRLKCPWDRKQTHASLVRYLLEEAYETADAIASGDDQKLREELGDVLLQVVLHSAIAEQRGSFTLEDVARGIADKMVRRHPHIYNRGKFKSYRDLGGNWTKLKAEENPDRYLLAGTPKAMPALQLSQRYGEIAASVGFDWGKASGVWDKLTEELGELKAELRRKKISKNEVAMELGDVFFTLANLARHWKIDAEAAARMSAAKFARRFGEMEKVCRARGKSLTGESPGALQKLWDAAKKSAR